MTSHWQFQPILGSYALVFALFVMLLVLLRVGPSFGQLSRQRGRTLLWLRAALFVLLLLAMLRPARVTTQKRVQTAQLLLLFDTSRSMDLRDAEAGKTRWEQQLAILRQAMPQLEDMGENFAVELIGFAGEIQPQPRNKDKLLIEAVPDGNQTDIGGALQEALQRHNAKRLGAVILMSDGAQRAMLAKSPPQQAARQLDRRATPLYTIALGESRDLSQSRMVAIETLRDEYSVFVKNEFALRVGVRIQGYVNQPVPVSLVVEDEQGGQVIAGPQELVATEDSQIVFGDFSFRPENAGQYKLRVRAREPGDTADSQEMIAFLNVREGGLRVLLLTSNPIHAEQKFIRQSLDESQDIELDVQYVSVLAQRPLDVNLIIQLDEYDVFVIGDVDANAIHPDNWVSIARLVQSGRGLMMYGGYHSFGPGGYANSALADVLPIRMSQLEYQRYDPNVAPRMDRHIQGPLLLLPTTDSSITHIGPDEESMDEWKSLKPLLGANKFDRLKDEAIVLAETPDGDPLLVQGGFEAGRVLALAADSTWRWWKYGRQDVHKKFWRQATLWLARRDRQQANSVYINLPQRRVMGQSRVSFETGLTDEAGDVVPDANLRASLTLPDGTMEDIAMTSSLSGVNGIVSNTKLPGIYRILVQALEGEEGARVIASQYADFAVYTEDFELSDPAANPGLLDMLAKMTSRVGGKSIAPEQLSNLLDDIKAAPPKDEIETQSKWQLGDTAWDAWTFFLLLVALLTTEWYLRKRWGLV